VLGGEQNQTVTTLDRIEAYSPASVYRRYTKAPWGAIEDQWILVRNKGSSPDDPHLYGKRGVRDAEELQDGMIVDATGRLLNPQQIGARTLIGVQDTVPLDRFNLDWVTWECQRASESWKR
jgi:hypothetical protein